METAVQVLLGKRGCFLTDFTGFSFYGFVRLVVDPVHTLLTPAASRSMEFTDVLKNFTYSV